LKSFCLTEDEEGMGPASGRRTSPCTWAVTVCRLCWFCQFNTRRTVL